MDRQWGVTRTKEKTWRPQKKKLSEGQIDSLIDCLSEDPTLTLDMLRLRIKAEFHTDVHISTISSYLDGRLLTFKKLHTVSETCNSEENKVKRINYVTQLTAYEDQGWNIIWIDETNFNLHCKRGYGRSRRGERAKITLTSTKGSNLHIIGAMSECGLVKYTLKRGSFTKSSFAMWMRDLLNELNTPTVIVCDNAPSHSNIEEIFRDPSFTQHRILRLGPYSPELNPIEGIWSILKNEIRKRMRYGYSRMMLGDPEGLLSKTEWRMRFLEDVATTSQAIILPTHCKNLVRHVKMCYSDVLSKRDL